MFKCNLELSNKDEWLEHLKKNQNTNSNKSNEETLLNACNFNFKFDTIPISQ